MRGTIAFWLWMRRLWICGQRACVVHKSTGETWPAPSGSPNGLTGQRPFPTGASQMAAAVRNLSVYRYPHQTAKNPLPGGRRSSPTLPVWSPWSIAWSTVPRSSSSKANPTAPRKPANATNSAPASAAGQSHEHTLELTIIDTRASAANHRRHPRALEPRAGARCARPAR